MFEVIKTWFATKSDEAARLAKSYSTYVVIIGSLVPPMWQAMPQGYKDSLYAAAPILQGVEPLIWAVGFFVAYWKARSTPQNIDVAKV